MRNLKRALSLLLSSTMVLGMLVMGSSAASYQDVDASNKNQEAIEVLKAVGIMEGIDTAGNFGPDQSVTRNQMAVIMAHLLNLDYDYYRGTNTFTDVPEWAAPYVAACVAEGVTAGIGNGLYGGENKVTAAQASLMIMKALGYFQYQEDFGSDWQVATIRQASYINMFDNIDATAETALSRAQVAQLVLNGLKSNMVTFTGDVGVQVGDVSVGYRPEYTAKTNANSKYNSIDTGKTDIAGNNQYYIQLGEELYNGDLKLKNGTDVFGRPARNWEYDGKEVGTYVNFDLMVKEYTTSVSGKDLYDVLTANTIKDYSLTVVIDGVADKNVNSNIFDSADMNKNNKDTVGATGNGVLTQVFVDNEKKDITISIINTYLAIADENYNEKKDEASLTVYGVEKKGDEYLKVVDSRKNSADDSVNLKLDGEDFDIASEIVEDDALLVTVANGEIQTAVKAQVVSDVEITAFQKNTSVTVDGTKYNYADTAEYNYEVLDNYTSTTDGTNLKNTTYNVYLDAYGYAIAVDQVEVPNNYVFITGVDDSYSNLGTKNLKASAIFLDGTMKTIDITSTKGDGKNMSDDATLNSWFTYTVDNDGIYTVTQVKNAIDTANGVKVAQHADDTFTKLIDKKNIYLPGTTLSDGTFSKVYGNDDSIYLTASIKEIKDSDGNNAIIIDEVDSVTTGLKNANIQPWAWDGTELNNVDTTLSDATARADRSAGVYTLYKSNGYIIASVVVGEDATASKNLVYVTSDSVEQESYDKTADEWTWTRKVSLNGEETTLKEVSDSLTYLNKMDQYNWYQVKYNADGEVIGVLDGGNDADFDNWNLNSNEYVTNIAGLDAAINAEDTVLFTQQFPNDKMSMIGNVLYATKTTSNNNGFYVSDEVKVVLTQTNKNETTTTFEVGAKALKNIVDTLNEKSGSYNYVLSAMIENGVATTVAIRDLTNTYEKPDGSTGSGDYFTYTANIYEYGMATVSLTANRPEWLDYDAANTLNYSFDVYVNGKLYEAGVTGSIAKNADDATQNWTNKNAANDFLFRPIKAGDVITIENFKWTNLSAQTYKVKYVDEHGQALDASLFTTIDASLDNSGDNLAFELNDKKVTGSFDYEVIGLSTGASGSYAYLTGTQSAGTATSDSVAAGKIKQVVDAKTLKDLENYVTVQIDTSALNGYTGPWDITAATDVDQYTPGNATAGTRGTMGATDGALYISVKANNGTTIANGAKFDLSNIQVALRAGGSAANFTDAYSYRVTIDGIGSVELNQKDKWFNLPSKLIDVTGNIEITKDMISIEVAEEKQDVVNATWSGNTVIVTFAEEISSASKADIEAWVKTTDVGFSAGGAGNTADLFSASVDGKTVTLTFSGTLKANNTIQLKSLSEVVASAGNTCDTTEDTLTLVAGGTTTLA